MAKQQIKWSFGHAKLKNLIDYEFNPVQINERAAKELAKDLRDDGQDLPYVIAAPFEKDKPLPLLDGHQRKHVDIEINKTDVNKPVLILYPDRKMTDKEKKRWIVRHRKNTGGFDFDILANFYDVPDLLEWGFSEKELTGEGFEIGESQDAEPQNISEQYIILIECDNEKEQNKLLERFIEEGLSCRALLS